MIFNDKYTYLQKEDYEVDTERKYSQYFYPFIDENQDVAIFYSTKNCIEFAKFNQNDGIERSISEIIYWGNDEQVYCERKYADLAKIQYKKSKNSSWAYINNSNSLKKLLEYILWTDFKLIYFTKQYAINNKIENDNIFLERNR